MNIEIQREQKLSSYLEEWINAKYPDWSYIVREISRNRRTGIYRLKHGTRIMDMLINIIGNIEEHFALDTGQHLIPAQFPSVDEVLNFLQRFDALIWTDYNRLIVSVYNEDNPPPMEICDISKICDNIHKTVERCIRVYSNSPFCENKRKKSEQKKI